MKKLIFITTIILISALINAQQPIFTSNPFPKTIIVSGSAEMEIIPDEIFVNITLREYQKRGEDKKDIETIKTNFFQSCKIAGIPDSVISIFSFTGYGNYFSFKKRKRDPNLMTAITYQVKFKDSKTMDALVEALDDEATQNFQIYGTSHSKIMEFRKQLKIKAVQAAKEKAAYLTDALAEKLGEAITIKEPNENLIPGVANNLYGSNAFQEVVGTGYSMQRKNGNGYEIEKEIDFKKLKLRFEVDVVFAVK